MHAAPITIWLLRSPAVFFCVVPKRIQMWWSWETYPCSFVPQEASGSWLSIDSRNTCSLNWSSPSWKEQSQKPNRVGSITHAWGMWCSRLRCPDAQLIRSVRELGVFIIRLFPGRGSKLNTGLFVLPFASKPKPANQTSFLGQCEFMVVGPSMRTNLPVVLYFSPCLKESLSVERP